MASHTIDLIESLSHRQSESGSFPWRNDASFCDRPVNVDSVPHALVHTLSIFNLQIALRDSVNQPTIMARNDGNFVWGGGFYGKHDVPCDTHKHAVSNGITFDSH